LRYNAHPDQLRREVPQGEWCDVLREVDRVVAVWAAQRTPEQSAWLRERQRARFMSPITAARAIVSQAV
jgi:hypothetical protein